MGLFPNVEAVGVTLFYWTTMSTLTALYAVESLQMVALGTWGHTIRQQVAPSPGSVGCVALVLWAKSDAPADE